MHTLPFLKLLQDSISSISESDFGYFSVLIIRAPPPNAGSAANYIGVMLTYSRWHTQIGQETDFDISSNTNEPAKILLYLEYSGHFLINMTF
jgi:hypothetical protein